MATDVKDRIFLWKHNLRRLRHAGALVPQHHGSSIRRVAAVRMNLDSSSTNASFLFDTARNLRPAFLRSPLLLGAGLDGAQHSYATMPLRDLHRRPPLKRPVQDKKLSPALTIGVPAKWYRLSRLWFDQSTYSLRNRNKSQNFLLFKAGDYVRQVDSPKSIMGAITALNLFCRLTQTLDSPLLSALNRPSSTALLRSPTFELSAGSDCPNMFAQLSVWRRDGRHRRVWTA
jgi:hypothetical protein